MKLKILAWLLWLIPIIAIPTWVFWETDHLIKVQDVKHALNNLHTVDFASVVSTYYFPVIITLSFYCNLLAIKYIRVFYTWVNNGKIRIGGKAGQD